MRAVFGGLAGTIGYAAMATALRNGFATASTDTGHTSAEPGTWMADRERLIDFIKRSWPVLFGKHGLAWGSGLAAHDLFVCETCGCHRAEPLALTEAPAT